jgi:hypothetical protein
MFFYESFVHLVADGEAILILISGILLVLVYQDTLRILPECESLLHYITWIDNLLNNKPANR